MYREINRSTISCDCCRKIISDIIHGYKHKVIIDNQYIHVRYFSDDMFYKPNSNDKWIASDYRLNEKRGYFISKLARINLYYCSDKCRIKHEALMLKHKIIKVKI